MGVAEAMLGGLGSRSLLAISAPTGTALRATTGPGTRRGGPRAPRRASRTTGPCCPLASGCRTSVE
jgi:hypothetical protein